MSALQIWFSILTKSRRHGEPVPFPTGQPSQPLGETPARIPINNSRAHLMPKTPLTNVEPPASAMRGVVLTDTGEVIPTPVAAPHPVELARLVLDSPKVGLNFGGIFDGRKDYEEESEDGEGEGEHAEPDDLASPSARRMLVIEQKERERKQAQEKENVTPVPSASVTRLRKPSIRATRPLFLPSSASCPDGLSNAPAQHPLGPASQSVPASTYDLDDEENLPSPFLKRIEVVKGTHSRRGSAAHDLRVKAAANAAGKKASRIAGPGSGSAIARPSLERAKQASEDAKKALFRP